jgi:hypothetical protein
MNSREAGMRADMGKVLVERPRVKSGYVPGPGKGYRKQLHKAMAADDSPPVREGIKKRYGYNLKHFNEHLGPLRRFLNSNVGRPWDKVYGEICEHVDRGNVVQKHILTHLFDYVIVTTVLIDGEPCDGRPGYRYGDPLRASARYNQWYICPKSGLLRRCSHVPRRPRVKRTELPRCVRVNKTEMCVELNGQWELVTVAPLPEPMTQKPAHDVLRKCSVYPWSADGARQFYGAAVYATARRPLSKRELKALPVPIDWVR